MSVPSRSRKTAGQLSLGEPVIFEAGGQFRRRNRRGAELGHDHGAGVIGDLRSFDGGRVAAKSESEQGNRSVACPGDVEHLTRFRWNMKRLSASLKKHHALFSERDEKQF